jgi:predicted ester cyclase
MKKVLFSFCTIAIIAIVISCNNNAEKPAASNTAAASVDSADLKNKQTIMTSMAAIMAHNADEALKNATADAIDYGDGSMPPAKGIDSVKAGLRGFLNAFPDYKGENLMYVAEGNTVIVTGDWSGTFKNDAWGMKATGKSFKVKDADIFTFNADGKITSHSSIQSNNTIMAMVDAKMPK